MENLSKKELLRLIKAYNIYIQEFFEVEEHYGMTPVCISEFFDNEYKYYVEVGELISFGSSVGNKDLLGWLNEHKEQKYFEVTEVDYDYLKIKDCPFKISIYEENWFVKEIL